MISKAVLSALKSFVPEENIFLQEPMATHTTFRTGGPADCLIEIASTEELQKIQQYLHEVQLPFFVLGNGSNLLVSDKGYRGIILHMGEAFREIRREGNLIHAKAGAFLSQVAAFAWKEGLTGLEFAAGIPGTIGGGVVMNAGAYGGELCQVVEIVRVLDKEGNELELDNETMEFGYRTSAIQNQSFIVTEVVIRLTPGDKDAIHARMEELAAKRREKQPLEYPSAGSTFKRPEGYYAGELIMKAGMRGFTVGGAQVSEKHCGFVINTGTAASADIIEVIEKVQESVKNTFGVQLEPEVILLGER